MDREDESMDDLAISPAEGASSTVGASLTGGGSPTDGASLTDRAIPVHAASSTEELSPTKGRKPQGPLKSIGQFVGKVALFTTVLVATIFLVITGADASSYDDLGYGWYATALALGLLAAIISVQVVEVGFSSRAKALANMGLRNLKRRKRNTALVIAGLLVGSAIITSSLVVGDSLDATLRAEFSESLDQTDILINGYDLYNNPVWMNESRMETFVDTLYNNSDIDAVSLGIITYVGLKSDIHKTVEARSGQWVAMDPDYQNQGAWSPFGGEDGPRYSDLEPGYAYLSEQGANKLKIRVGEPVEVSWTDFSITGETTRKTTNFTISEIVPTKASGYENGGEPTIYTTLLDAQEALGRQGEVNRATVSALGGVFDAQEAENRVLPFINQSLEEAIIGEDIGIEIATVPEDFSLAVQRSTGDGLLSGEEVSSLRENITDFSSELSTSELLMAPALRISSGGQNLSGLIASEITDIDSDEIADWYATPAGLSVQVRETSQWFQWVPKSNFTSIQRVISLSDGAALSLHQGGVRLSVLSEDVDSQDITIPEGEGNIVGITVGGSGTAYALRISDDVVSLVFGESYSDGAIVWDESAIDIANISASIEGGKITSQEDSIFLRLEAGFSSYTCKIDVEDFNTEFNSCNWNLDPPQLRDIVEVGGISWDHYGQDLQLTFSRLSGGADSAHDLGLPSGDVTSVSATSVVVNGTEIYFWTGSIFEHVNVSGMNHADNRKVWSNGTSTITTSENGVLISTPDGIRGRIPYQISLDGLTTLPLVALALSGGSGLPEPTSGEIYLSQWAGTGLALSYHTEVGIVGLWPAARGNFTPLELNYTFQVPVLPAPPGQPGLDDIAFGIVNMSDASLLMNRDDGARSMLMAAGLILSEGENLTQFENFISNWADEIAGINSSGISATPIKTQIRDRTADSGANFSTLFLIFGSFVIFAGILLVMNLFVMLADERKSEMGMMRALGMQRGELRTMFVFEGTIVALLSSAVGAVCGIGVAKLLMVGLDAVVASTFQGAILFAWDWHSVLSGFSLGFLVTYLTLMATSIYISRLNVVAAMRDIPTRLKGTLPWWTILVSLFLLGVSALFAILAFMIGDAESGSSMAWWLSAGFIGLFGVVPPVYYILSKALPKSLNFREIRLSRASLTPRLTMTGLGLAMFGWGIWTDPVRADWEPGDASFIVLGIFLVSAGVLLLTSLAPVVARVIARAGSQFSKKLASVLPTALAYPLATPFRTAMTMGMFSLVVFAVVVLSGYSALIGNWLGDLGEDARGEWEVVAFGDLDLPEDTDEWDLGGLDVNEFDGIATMFTSTVQVYAAGETDLENHSSYTNIRGFDSNFTSLGGLPLHSWEPSLGETKEDVWASILANDTLVVIDYTMAVDSYQGEGGVVHKGMALNIGDALVVQDPYNPAINETFFVGAVLGESSGWFASGVSVAKPTAVARFDASPTSIWFSLPPGSTLGEQEEVSNTLQYELVEEGAVVFAIEVEFKEIQSFIFAMFNLLKAFLALGLVVGIAGLGVITIRNVSERAHQTGILRALGFQRSMVVAGYLTELTWISLLGILNGAAVGVGFHYQLYIKFLKDEGAEFVLPWQQISLIVIGSYLLTLLATIWPVRKAANIHPAEALRDIE